MEDIGFMKGISGAGNPSSLTNFDAHARPNKIYALDVCSVLTSFRDPLEWRREGEPARLVSKTATEDGERHGEGAGGRGERERERERGPNRGGLEFTRRSDSSFYPSPCLN